MPNFDINIYSAEVNNSLAEVMSRATTRFNKVRPAPAPDSVSYIAHMNMGNHDCNLTYSASNFAANGRVKVEISEDNYLGDSIKANLVNIVRRYSRFMQALIELEEFGD
jgi:hypothetical protein